MLLYTGDQNVRSGKVDRVDRRSRTATITEKHTLQGRAE